MLRRLLLSFTIVACGAPDAGDLASDVAKTTAEPLTVYASGYGRTIGTYHADRATGALTRVSETQSFGSSPSFLALNPARTRLYAVDENTNKVGAYSIENGAPRFLASVSSHGNGPAHVAVDAAGTHVLVANYDGASIAVIATDADGGLGSLVDSSDVAAGTHEVALEPGDAHLWVPCKSGNKLFVFPYDDGHLGTPRSIDIFSPRHVAFRPPYALVVSERKSMLTVLSMDDLSVVDAQSTLPAGFTDANTGGEVWVHPNGKLVYTSNRGHDSIAEFTLDASGHLRLVGTTPSGGKTPRNFTIDPSGTLLWAANQDSGLIVPFRIAGDGTLARTGATVPFTNPTFLGVR